MAYYRIHLQPVAPFFFGTELKAELGNKQSYFQVSRLFPQQTTLLGMLRHQLILQKGLIPINGTNRNSVGKLIGEKSFQYDSSDKAFKNFGAIQRISPVFLGKEDKDFYISDKTFVTKEKQQTELLVKHQKATSESFLFKLEGDKLEHQDVLRYKYGDGDFYLAKHPFVSLMRDYGTGAYLQNEKGKKELDSITHSPEKVGIDKAETNDKDSAGYFKMRYQHLALTSDLGKVGADTPYENKFAQYELSKAWGFSCYIELKEDERFSFDRATRFVTMGKEQSVFKMSIQDLNEKVPKVFEKEENIDLSEKELYRITLVSDTFVTNEHSLYSKCIFINADTIRFRNIMTDTNTGNYYKTPNKSGAFNLLKRGALLYVDKDNIDTVKIILNERQDLKQIGYNHFIIEKQKNII